MEINFNYSREVIESNVNIAAGAPYNKFLAGTYTNNQIIPVTP